MFKYITNLFNQNKKSDDENILVSFILEVDKQTNINVRTKWSSYTTDNANLLARLIYCVSNGIFYKQTIEILSSNKYDELDTEFLNLTILELQRLEKLTDLEDNQPLVSPTSFAKTYATK